MQVTSSSTRFVRTRSPACAPFSVEISDFTDYRGDWRNGRLFASCMASGFADNSGAISFCLSL